MKKSILALAFSLLLINTSTQADIIVTNMTINSSDYAVTGNLFDAGGGYIETPTASFLGGIVVASQETLFMDNSGSWSGVNPFNGQSFDYGDEISAMTENQLAVGMYWAWKDFSLHGGSLLNIFECNNGICTGQGVPMDNGGFAGQVVSFSGTGSASVVPVPATVWLFGSGLVGLIGIARRRQAA